MEKIYFFIIDQPKFLLKFNETFDMYANQKEWEWYYQWHHWEPEKPWGLSDYHTMIIKGKKDTFLDIFQECHQWSTLDQNDLLRVFYLLELDDHCLSHIGQGNLPLLIGKTDFLTKRRREEKHKIKKICVLK